MSESFDTTVPEEEGRLDQALPSLSLPKGGGAIRGLGETLTAHPATGTGSMSVPIDVGSGRSGFGPALSLTYDSGAGNGPLGLGWSLPLPTITRKTEKGLPRYGDADESDVFLLSGAEDLVPVGQEDGEPGFRVDRYRPRVEGLFARIERWTREDDPGDVHWRSLSRDNVLTIYGRDAESRIFDPAASEPRVFSWLISETRDDRGNAVVYRYKAEDGAGIDLGRVSERGRGDRDDPRRGAQRYPKRILYGNRRPLLDPDGERPAFLDAATLDDAGWMFEVVLDYGEHDPERPTPAEDAPWSARPDPFSRYRAGFEIRTARRCRRILRFHHFPDEPGVGADCLVAGVDLAYDASAEARAGGYSYLASITRTGYVRRGDGYLARRLPPLELDYSRPVVQDRVEEVDPAAVESLPQGVDGAVYRWTDLHGEGAPGILTEQAGAWLYRRNTGPLGESADFGPWEPVPRAPRASLADGARLVDVGGDGRPDVAVLDGPAPGFYEHDEEEGWASFRPFPSALRRDARDPNLRFVDLTGDGRADVLITEDDAFSWHASLAREGFAPAERVPTALDEDRGPRVVFRNGDESVALADLSGDGLADLVRIRNGEVCYWPNLGYGRFGAKVTMDSSPRFDRPEHFDPARLRLADVDGSGPADLLYLHRRGVRLYLNRSGNAWAEARSLDVFPRVDELASVEVLDLLGNGTACLAWSSPLADDGRRPLRYVDLMGGTKPHLLTRVTSHLGAETRVRYAPSTRFYQRDRRDGRPWRRSLPFPVQVVERIETLDHVGRNRFVSRYAYHDGYFDPVEREFRGFAEVEQWDTEHMEALGDRPDGVPGSAPAHVRSVFHVGLPVPDQPIYDDPAVDGTAGPEEEREAHRALRGRLLRREVYGLDGSAAETEPYSVETHRHAVRRIQARGGRRHGVFLVHPLETLTRHTERNPGDARIGHQLTLSVDSFGHALETVSVGYGRRTAATELPTAEDRGRQTEPKILYAERRVTEPIDTRRSRRSPLPAGARTFELTGYEPSGADGRFRRDDFVRDDFVRGDFVPEDAGLASDTPLLFFDNEVDGEVEGPGLPTAGRQRRLLEETITFYRPDDLGASLGDPLALLPEGRIEPRALPGETYRLALTPSLLARLERDGEPLLPDPEPVLAEGGYVDLHGDGRFWVPSGRVFYSLDPDPVQELREARDHFFLPRRIRDPFGAGSETDFDAYDLLPVESRDAVGHRLTAGLRSPTGEILPGNDYRVLQPRRITDANRNLREVAFDALGRVVATAASGAPEEALGDSLDGLEPDLDEAVIVAALEDPLADPAALLGRAGTRVVYDLFAYHRTRHTDAPRPAAVLTLARETHDAELAPGESPAIQQAVVYSDGFGREVQHKRRAQPGPVPERDDDGRIRLGPDGRPVLGDEPTDRRWIGSGWTVFDDKGRPVRHFEPFFSDTHRFEFDVRAGVASTVFYDPLGRAIATLHPNHTWEKVVHDPWKEARWDASDTVLDDPRADPDVGGAVAGYVSGLEAQDGPWQTWHARRASGALGELERQAAAKAAIHAGTPTTVHLDALGRPFLTVTHNRLRHEGHRLDGLDETLVGRTELDVQGRVIEVRDPVVQNGDLRGRAVARTAYDLLGRPLRQESSEAGRRWTLAAIDGQSLRGWDERGRILRTGYDLLRRPVRQWVRGADPEAPEREVLTELTVFGERHPEAEARNLRGVAYLRLDSAGAVTVEASDFKGNPLQSTQRIARDYRGAIDWSPVDATLSTTPSEPFDVDALEAVLAPRLEDERFATETRYDALDRPTEMRAPDGSRLAPRYGVTNLLDGLDVALAGGDGDDGEPAWTPFVVAVDHDAAGRRQRIDYGNGTRTTHTYDPWTSRPVRVQTRRDPQAFPDDCPQPPPDDPPGCNVQDLRYTYDPVGNVTHVRDAARQAIFFRNRRVDADADFTYDALYRLVAATGREHLGQNAAPQPHDPDDAERVGVAHPGDGNAVAAYLERYVYDAVGNLLALEHRGADPSAPGWTREFTYAEASLLEPAKTGNRLTRTDVGELRETYSTDGDGYDAHGNLLRLPHLQELAWDAHDRLCRVRRQASATGGGERTFYVYDAEGRRTRKVTESAGGEILRERLYLGTVEIERRRRGPRAGLERRTLHVMDGEHRLALVETRTAGSDPGPARLVRYQHGNHLGSVSLELDEGARVISYEEYTPYGSSAYQAVGADVAPKRYRFTGMERDEETGFTYHGARYYAPWLGRWTSPDPIGIEGGLGLYVYAGAAPTRLVDLSGLKPKEKEQKEKEKKARDQQVKDDTRALKKIRDDEEIQSAIGQAAQITGIDEETLEEMIIIESRGDKTASKGSYYGLMQMGKTAFEDVRDSPETKDDFKALRIDDGNGGQRALTWNDVKTDPTANVVVGALYARLNLERLRRYNARNEKKDQDDLAQMPPNTDLEGRPQIAETTSSLYLIHQQGFDGLKQIYENPDAEVQDKHLGNLSDFDKSRFRREGEGNKITNEEFIQAWEERAERLKKVFAENPSEKVPGP